MKGMITIGCVLPLLAVVPAAQADTLTNYKVTETFYEPMTQPDNTIFTGSFTFDSTTNTVLNLQGSLTESMTGTPMATVPLSYQLVTASDGLGGELVYVFANNTTNTFVAAASNGDPGNGYAPGSGNSIYYGFPGPNPSTAPAGAGQIGNAYALIDVNLSNPTTALSSAQTNFLAYADCTSLGMMGPVCMTGTTKAGYGVLGTMGGYPVSEVITGAVPEPGTYALLAAGLGVLGVVVRRRRPN